MHVVICGAGVMGASTAHNCRGMLKAPATGLAVSEQREARCVDRTPPDPGRRGRR